MSASGEIRYPIRAVSRLTGIGIDTLRAWERRYGVVTPERGERGRVYTEADVERLRLLQAAVAAGHRVGQVAGLTNAELERLAIETTPHLPVPPRVEAAAPLDTAAFRAALASYDMIGVDRELSRLAVTLRPLPLVRDALMPALAQVAEEAMAGRLGPGYEHLVSANIRNLLGAFLRIYARPGAETKLMFSTPSGDRHELGILGAAMLAASSGFWVSYLGPDLPARDIVGAARAAGVRVLVIGLTLEGSRKSLERELRAIIDGLPPNVELWAGGRAAAAHAGLLSKRGRLLEDFDAFQQALDRISGEAREGRR